MKTTIINTWKSFKEGFVDDFIHVFEYGPVEIILGLLFDIAFVSTVMVSIKDAIINNFGIIDLGFFGRFFAVLGFLISIIILLAVAIVIGKVILAVIAGFKNIKK